MALGTENGKKKEYLWRYRNSLKKQKSLELEIRETRLNRMTLSLIQDGMPHGSGKGDLSDYIVQIDGLLARLGQEVQASIDARREIVGKIEQMESETEKLILRFRYINGMKWEKVAEEMDYEVRHVTRIHGKALKHFKMS